MQREEFYEMQLSCVNFKSLEKFPLLIEKSLNKWFIQAINPMMILLHSVESRKANLNFRMENLSRSAAVKFCRLEGVSLVGESLAAKVVCFLAWGNVACKICKQFSCD